MPILTNPAMDQYRSQDAQEYAATYAKAIVIPNNDPQIRYRLLEPTRGHETFVFDQIQTFLDSLALPLDPGTRVFTSGNAHDTTGYADTESDGASTGSEPDEPEANDTTWRVKRDSSIKLPDGRALDQRYRGVRWVGVEVMSPALWFHSPASLAEVRRVCDALKAKYWIVFSPSTAVHIHVGRGDAWPPLRALRRTAALLFAADPLLATLYPPHRREGRYCASNRSFSALAQGMTAERARQMVALAIGGVDRMPDAEPPESLGDYETTPTTITTQPQRAFHRRIPRGTLRGYPQPAPGEGPRFPHLNIELNTPRNMIECAEELLSASRRGVVAILMLGSRFSSRLAYSLLNFRERRKGDERHKRTVEFRQPAATLDADEVLAFVRLFVGLCRFAGEAEFEEVRAAIHRCAVVDEADGQGEFDVFDLLTQIGLVAEAEELQRLIMIQGDRVAPAN